METRRRSSCCSRQLTVLWFFIGFRIERAIVCDVRATFCDFPRTSQRTLKHALLDKVAYITRRTLSIDLKAPLLMKVFLDSVCVVVSFPRGTNDLCDKVVVASLNTRQLVRHPVFDLSKHDVVKHSRRHLVERLSERDIVACLYIDTTLNHVSDVDIDVNRPDLVVTELVRLHFRRLPVDACCYLNRVREDFLDRLIVDIMHHRPREVDGVIHDSHAGDILQDLPGDVVHKVHLTWTYEKPRHRC